MQKKGLLFCLVLVVSAFLAINIAGAQNLSSDSEVKNLTVVMNEIMSSQSVDNKEGIDCDKVSDDQFEELGDSVMEQMAGSNQAHEVMEQMMGGEGSTSLQSVHIVMGTQYLGCRQNSYLTAFGPVGMMGMMGYGRGMMGGLYNGSSIFGAGLGLGVFGYVLTLVVHGILLGLFIMFVVYVAGRAWRASMNEDEKKKK